MTGMLALVGSGEYLPEMTAVEALLLAGRAPRYVQLATAAAPEGDASLARWHRLGRDLTPAHIVDAAKTMMEPNITGKNGLGSTSVNIALRYLSVALNWAFIWIGVWAAIHRAWLGGASLAGCSAGAMALTGWVPSIRSLGRHPDHGLGLLPHLRVLPHFDRMLGWAPDILTAFAGIRRAALLGAPGTRAAELDWAAPVPVEVAAHVSVDGV